jgi:branched-chain amino acid transport system substrate-binding protein
VGGATDFARFKQGFVTTCERMYGATGWLAVNEHGDRREDWDFDFWVLKNDGGKYFWEKSARYQFEPGTAKELFISSGQPK